MVERLHRTLKAALKCTPQPWVDALPSVLLGLRTIFKDDLKASPAEMVYGTTLRIPGEFFTSSTPVADKSTFVRSLRHLFKALQSVPASRHTTQRPFVFKDLSTCTHVFKRIDSIKKPLEPPYTGPHRVLNRNDPRTFTIEVEGEAKVVSTDQLKPAHLEESERVQEFSQQLSSRAPPTKSDSATPLRAQPTPPPVSRARHVTFADSPKLLTGGGVDVASQPCAQAAPSLAPPSSLPIHELPQLLRDDKEKKKKKKKKETESLEYC
ncbi:uncharacterized protein LOC106641970 [Copidosoma floridanum]|uniref:uncharacterized protein LOC106641970 n=1 Tax=Copidosoma floridanum TaxID=29053 RepID=UPI0006C9BBED|nr:uncharacterized protein LOC106641970 [Copidosoma floridanum]